MSFFRSKKSQVPQLTATPPTPHTFIDDEGNPKDEIFFPSDLSQINVYDTGGYTLLHRLMMYRTTPLTITQFVQKGADMNLKTYIPSAPPADMLDLLQRQAIAEIQQQQQQQQQENAENQQNPENPAQNDPNALIGAEVQNPPAPAAPAPAPAPNPAPAPAPAQPTSYKQLSVFHLLFSNPDYYSDEKLDALLNAIPAKSKDKIKAPKSPKSPKAVPPSPQLAPVPAPAGTPVATTPAAQPEPHVFVELRIKDLTDAATGENVLMKALTLPITIARLRLLIEKLGYIKKSQFQEVDLNQNTALHYAILYKQDVSIINLLLQSGCDVNALNSDKQTALAMALGSKQWTSLESLIVAGANVGLNDKHGRSPLHIAIKTLDCPSNIIMSILDSPYCNVEYKTVAKRNALMEAVEFARDPAILQRIINKTSDINHADASGMAPIHFASNGYHINAQTINLLLAHPKINANATTLGLWNALTFALRSKAPVDVVQALLDANVDPNLMDTENQDPFICAVQYHCRLPIIQLLLPKTNIYKLYDHQYRSDKLTIGEAGPDSMTISTGLKKEKKTCCFTAIQMVVLKEKHRPRVDAKQHDTEQVLEAIIHHHIDNILSGHDKENMDNLLFLRSNVIETNVCDDF